jgi:hypothetical protein
VTVRPLRARRFAWRLGLGGALACSTSATESAAREPSRGLPVELEVDPCTGVAPDVVSRILTVELGVGVTFVPVGEASDSAQKPDTTQVALSCDEGTIRIFVRDPLTGKTLERHIDLRAERPSARPRLLSLSAAELVAASWIELEAPPPPAPVVEATAPPPARSEAADIARAAMKRQEPAQWDVEALALGRRFPDANLTTWGGGIAANWAYQGWLAVGGDIVGESGGGDLALDGVIVGQASVWSGSVGLSARLRQTWPTLSLEAGLGGRLGVAKVHATADATQLGLWQEHGFSGTWGGPLATVRVGWKASRMVLLVGSVEAGTVTRQLAGLVARQPELLITGPWAALSLGVGIGADAGPTAK